MEIRSSDDLRRQFTSHERKYCSNQINILKYCLLTLGYTVISQPIQEKTMLCLIHISACNLNLLHDLTLSDFTNVKIWIFKTAERHLILAILGIWKQCISYEYLLCGIVKLYDLRLSKPDGLYSQETRGERIEYRAAWFQHSPPASIVLIQSPWDVPPGTEPGLRTTKAGALTIRLT